MRAEHWGSVEGQGLRLRHLQGAGGVCDRKDVIVLQNRRTYML